MLLTMMVNGKTVYPMEVVASSMMMGLFTKVASSKALLNAAMRYLLNKMEHFIKVRLK
jgi:hypothetical protein